MSELAQALDSALSKLRSDLDSSERLKVMESRIMRLEGALASRRPSGVAYAPTMSADSASSIPDLSASAIRAHRRSIGITQAQFSRLLGVCLGTFATWERGRTRPNAENRAKLVEALRLPREEALRRVGRCPESRDAHTIVNRSMPSPVSASVSPERSSVPAHRGPF